MYGIENKSGTLCIFKKKKQLIKTWVHGLVLNQVHLE